MKFYKYLLSTAVLLLILGLSACGGTETTTPEGTVSPSPSAVTTTIPAETEHPDSVTEEDTNPGDVTREENSVMPGENHPDSAMGSDREDSTAGDDLRQAGDDLEDAARNTIDSVEDGIDDIGR